MPVDRLTEGRALGRILGHWAPLFRRLYGSDLPDDYVALDVETTGFDRAKDLILEFGWCRVRGREVVRRGGIVLDWSDHHVVPDEWLYTRLRELARTMRLDGKSWRLDYGTMRELGVPPEKGLARVLRKLDRLRDEQVLCLGQNFYSFDAQMLAANFRGFLGVRGWEFGANAILDTGILQKALQALDRPGMLPTPQDTLRSYSTRVADKRLPGVKWNLDGHCAPKYGLFEKHGLDASQAHSAGFDAEVVCRLYEEYRELVAEAAAAPADPGPAAVPFVPTAANANRTPPAFRRQRNF